MGTMSAESTPGRPAEGGSAESRRLGGYTLGTRVGEGGMGVVWRARPDGAPADGSRDVAIKVLRPHIAHDPDARTRLAREVATLSRVSSPRIAAVLDADTTGSAPYIVTEFVPGPPLDQVVEAKGPVTGPALVDLGRGLSEALTAIHRVGIVHRDLKPGNVLMVGSDPVVIDFGIAQVADDVRLTMTGLVMGTPGYLSPEVVEGGAVTEATDWWGWAATLAFAASGTPPFGRGPMSVVLDRVIRGRTQLEGVDPQLRPLLAAALDPDPERRPHSEEVMAALELYAANRPVTEALTVRVPRGNASGGPTGPEGTAPATSGAWAPADPTVLNPGVDPTRVQPSRPGPQTRLAPQEPAATARPTVTSRGRELGAPPVGQSGVPVGSAPPGERGLPSHPGAPAGGAAPGGSPYDPPPGVPGATPRGGPDPRIGRPMRTGTLAAGLVALVGLSALAPLLAWGLFVIWSLAARTADHAMTALVLRRHEAGPRRSDVPLTVLASPWHLFVAALATGLAMLLPLAFTVAAAVITSGLLTETGLLNAGVEHPVPVAVGSVLGMLMAWWGPGGLALRRGSRTMVRALTPGPLVTQLLVTVLLVAGVSVLGYTVVDAGTVSWWPTDWTTAPFTDLIPQVLRP